MPATPDLEKYLAIHFLLSLGLVVATSRMPLLWCAWRTRRPHETPASLPLRLLSVLSSASAFLRSLYRTGLRQFGQAIVHTMRTVRPCAEIPVPVEIPDQDSRQSQEPQQDLAYDFAGELVLVIQERKRSF